MSERSTQPVYVIAEAGVNHNGSAEMAFRRGDSAASTGADAIKFQTFRADALVTSTAVKADYQNEGDDASTQLEMLRRLELSEETFAELAARSRESGLEFLSTPFDLDSIELLHRLGMRRWKVPSGEINNLPYLRKIGSLRQKVILSTGTSDLEEVQLAVNALEETGTPRHQITVLHCTTAYPAPLHEVHLRAMQTIGDTLPGVGIGYSAHTLGIEVSVAAVALGAMVIEKHFTLDRTLPGPDHTASLEPGELQKMIAAIRNVERALGDGIKRPTATALTNLAVVRKSIVAARPIAEGERFTIEYLTVKRPGTGVSPMKWDDYISRIATRAYRKDELIDA